MNWTTDKLRQLTSKALATLRENALARNGTELVNLIDSLSPCSRNATPTGKQMLEWTDSDISNVANRLKQLPVVREGDAGHRRARLPRVISSLTVANFWRIYVCCVFSTQEKSGPGSNLDRFENSSSNLLQLDRVLTQYKRPGWIEAEVRAYGFYRVSADVKAVECLGRLLESATVRCSGMPVGPILMKDLPAPDDHALRFFRDLAAGVKNDHELASSGIFSAELTPHTKPLYGVGDKQMRNILVNTGLAINVLPLDSRWQNWLKDNCGVAIEVSPTGKYLRSEHLIRLAVMAIRDERQDLCSLAVVDRLVFDSFI